MRDTQEGGWYGRYEGREERKVRFDAIRFDLSRRRRRRRRRQLRAGKLDNNNNNNKNERTFCVVVVVLVVVLVVVVWSVCVCVVVCDPFELAGKRRPNKCKTSVHSPPTSIRVAVFSIIIRILFLIPLALSLCLPHRRLCHSLSSSRSQRDKDGGRRHDGRRDRRRHFSWLPSHADTQVRHRTACSAAKSSLETSNKCTEFDPIM